MTVRVEHGDSRDVIKTLADGSVDSVVCDPPYALVSIVKRFGKPGAAPAKEGADGRYKRASAGFMNKTWDTGETAFDPAFWVEVMRVMKPGAHLIAFGGTRSYHRLACAIEDAGFEIRDQLGWLYGSGFPKSHDVSKGIDKAAGLEREVIRERYTAKRIKPGATVVREGAYGKQDVDFTATDTAPASKESAAWQGWGTALKPAWEPIVLARKPLVGTVAANVLQHGTGALNIDGCRVEGDENTARPNGVTALGVMNDDAWSPKPGIGGGSAGRWPANVIHDGSEEALAAFPDSAGQQGDVRGTEPSSPMGGSTFGRMDLRVPAAARGDNGSAARFFYQAEKDTLCDLCDLPYRPSLGNIFPCDASTAEPSLLTESTRNGASALSDAADSQLREKEGKRPLLSGRARDAGGYSSQCLPPGGDSAQPNVPPELLSRIAQNVRSAASLCDSCAIAIAQSLAASRQGQGPASPLTLASISEHKRQILSRSLALHVAGRENTDTITTIPSLKMLFGSVFHAIAESTSKEGAAKPESSGRAPKRFHYSSKADSSDRLQSRHPTVKPVDLMAYLCRLVTPPGGTVLDPFAGSGTTGMACLREGFDCILIERESEYVADIHRRLAHVEGADTPLFAEPYDGQSDFGTSYNLACAEMRKRVKGEAAE